MLFGCTYWVLLLLMPVLNYTADEVEFVYKQFYDVSARKKTDRPSLVIVEFVMTTWLEKKTLKKKGVLLSFGRETTTENLCSNDTTIVLTCFMVAARQNPRIFSITISNGDLWGFKWKVLKQFWHRKKIYQNSTLIFLPNKSQIKKIE